ncbi:helix-turn-helix domain-containing protein [Chthonobacter rhizosphaerae]|uniref:helix-turn-helix transcriptional regulator n=1 Tax=Chthonobacter rhizosphaerae TaxID=2735553 RepID=UPI0015EF321E
MVSELKAEQLRAARAYVGFSQKELANITGITTQTIRRLERNGIADASFATVSKLTQAFQSGGLRFTDTGGVEPVSKPETVGA